MIFKFFYPCCKDFKIINLFILPNRLHSTLVFNLLGDSLTYHNGFAWSTRDSENDIDDVRHCAQAVFGAWWYGACEMSNLNGPYVTYPGTLTPNKYGEGIMWGSWLYQSYSFPKTEMKIRPAHLDFPI